MATIQVIKTLSDFVYPSNCMHILIQMMMSFQGRNVAIAQFGFDTKHKFKIDDDSDSDPIETPDDSENNKVKSNSHKECTST